MRKCLIYVVVKKNHKCVLKNFLFHNKNKWFSTVTMTQWLSIDYGPFMESQI